MTYGDNLENATCTIHYPHLEHCHCHTQNQLCTDIEVMEMLGVLEKRTEGWAKLWCMWAKAWLSGEVTGFSLQNEETLLAKSEMALHHERCRYGENSDLAVKVESLQYKATWHEARRAVEEGFLEYKEPCGHASKNKIYVVEEGKGANNPGKVKGETFEMGVCRECVSLHEAERFHEKERDKIGGQIKEEIDRWVIYGDTKTLCESWLNLFSLTLTPEKEKDNK